MTTNVVLCAPASASKHRILVPQETISISSVHWAIQTVSLVQCQAVSLPRFALWDSPIRVGYPLLLVLQSFWNPSLRMHSLCIFATRVYMINASLVIRVLRASLELIPPLDARDVAAIAVRRALDSGIPDFNEDHSDGCA